MIFLRPWWLLLICVPFLFHLWNQNQQLTSVWRKVIDKKLLPYLLVRGRGYKANRRQNFLRILLWILLSVAMAGPAWDKENVPTRVAKPATVLVMELSPAFSETDLQKAKQKLHDILTLLRDEQVALVLFDRFGYTASPLTFETDITRQMIPYLTPDLLPETQVDPLAGFQQADILLRNAGVDHGRILFITAGTNISSELIAWARRSAHEIGILGIGDTTPHPIPLPKGGFLTDSDGRTAMVALNELQLSKLGTYQALTAGDADIENLLKKTEPYGQNNEDAPGMEAGLWQDRGPWLVVFALPFFAFLFRRQGLFVILLLMAVPVQAGLWQRPEQADYERRTRAVELYRSGDYETAGSLFFQGLTADDLYNAGNALAFQGKIDEAIAAYEKALQQDENHIDARDNKAYLEQQQQKQQSESQQGAEGEQSDSPETENNDGSGDNGSENNNTEDETESDTQNQPDKNHSETGDMKTETDGDTDSAEQPEEKESETPHSAVHQENSHDNNSQPLPVDTPSENPSVPDSSVFDQESTQVLNKLPPDEARVLRYRIRKQYQRYIKEQKR